ncbi:MAG: hypothetical protein Q4B22_12210 [Eubacteriales bacterium]|nr:hypothetical protein [Eubacteriales bacterium]
MAAELKAGDKAYFLESNRTVKPCQVVRPEGNLVLIRFNTGGGMRIHRNRLYASEEEAAQQIRPVPTDKPTEQKRRGYRSLYDYYWH